MKLPQRKANDERPYLKRGISMGDVARFERRAQARRGEGGKQENES